MQKLGCGSLLLDHILVDVLVHTWMIGIRVRHVKSVRLMII